MSTPRQARPATQGPTPTVANTQSASSTEEPARGKKNPFALNPIAGVKHVVFSGVATYQLPDNPETKQYVPTIDPDWLITTQMGELIVGVDMDANVLLTGDAGTGKTSVVQQMCAVRNYPFQRVNFSQGVREADLFGRWRLKRDGSGAAATEWVDGPVTLALKQGHVLCLDEIDFADPSYLVAIRNLMETGNRHLRLMGHEGEVLTPHPQFRVCATANSIGNSNRLIYAGANLMNLADLDRFAWTIHMEHLPEEQECELVLRKTPGLQRDEAADIIKVANMVRKANEEGETTYPFGLRAVLKWAKAVVIYEHPGFALDGTVVCALEDGEAQFVRECFHRVFGEN